MHRYGIFIVYTTKGYDAFCSRECGEKVHRPADVEYIPRKDFFEGFFLADREKCFTCSRLLLMEGA